MVIETTYHTVKCMKCGEYIRRGEQITRDGIGFNYHPACLPADRIPEPVTTEYGVGRVPADVDATAEALATLDATQATQPANSGNRARCDQCGRMGSRAVLMHSSARGLVCPDCYDDEENR